jgi:hypothetical protein
MGSSTILFFQNHFFSFPSHTLSALLFYQYITSDSHPYSHTEVKGCSAITESVTKRTLLTNNVT